MNTSQPDYFLYVVAYGGPVVSVLAYIALALWVYRVSRRQAATEAAVTRQLDRLNGNMVSLTQQFSAHKDTTQQQFQAIANRNEMQAIMDATVTRVAAIMGREIVMPPANTIIAGTNHLGGPVVGGNVGRMEPPGKSERPMP